MAPRDVLAHSIDSELKRRCYDSAFLYMTHLGKAFLVEHFPHIYTTCLAFGFDMAVAPIPVVPAAHYVCGGVCTDLQARTTLPGLLAAGEVACTGVHGANRLASNSLLEGLVFGMRAASAAVDFAGQHELSALSSQETTLRAGQFGILEDAEKLRSSLRRTMWGQVGVIRSGESLIRACAQLSRWAQLVTQPFASRAALEVKNMLHVAQCVAEAALWRENSVGAHYRSDFPEAERTGWQQHSRLSSGEVVSEKISQKSRGLLLSPREHIGRPDAQW